MVKRLYTKPSVQSQGSLKLEPSLTSATHRQKAWTLAQHSISWVIIARHFCLLPPHCYSPNSIETKEDKQALNHMKDKQKFYYNHQAKPLTPLTTREMVRMQLPGEKTWTPGVCMGQSGPWSYKVKVGDQEYRRIRCQLLQTKRATTSPKTQTTPD